MNLVKEIFPEADSYAEVYHKYNLLTDKVRLVGDKDGTILETWQLFNWLVAFHFNDDNNVDLQTVMAHGCYLSEKELALFRETGTSLSHCPNSNIS